jgi:hypothetical protein
MKYSRFFLPLGTVLMLMGCGLPFMMVIKILPSTFFLNFFSWGASVSGLYLGMIGVASYARMKK